MGFEWTENVGEGASIDAADITEIRTNVDTVDDEKCAADKVSYDNDYKDGDDATHNPGYYNNQHSTYKSGNLLGVDTTNNPGYENDDNGAYEGADLAGVLGMNNPGYQVDYHSSYLTDYYPGAKVPY